MEPPPKPTATSLFQVYLRLRPSQSTTLPQNEQLYPQLPPPERFLTVEVPPLSSEHLNPTHITIHPPTDSRKRAVEKFAFTRVFEEDATQLDIFKGTGAISLVQGVLREGRDGLMATLGVTGSGKVDRDFPSGYMDTANNFPVEPHYTRIQDPTRAYPIISRSCIPIARCPNSASFNGTFFDWFSRCIGCVRGTDSTCVRISRRNLRRVSARAL